MGKRKRSDSAAPDLPSDFTPCSSGRDITPGENSSEPDDNSLFKPLSSAEGIMDGHGKQPDAQLSLGQHHYNMTRAMFSKRSRHHYGNQYSRRKSPNYHRPSASYGRGSPLHDERLCFKLGGRYNSEFGHRPEFSEFREKAFWRHERIRTSPSVIDPVAPETAKMTCGICQKLLKRKPYQFGSTSTLSSGEQQLSIVAVLVCGHIYHADCLEQRTHPGDMKDPSCPVCLGLIDLPVTETA